MTPEQRLEYRVKGAFLYAFARYVAWPAGSFDSPTNTLVIGVLGCDPFGDVLENLSADKVIDRHPISIRRFAQAQQVTGAHVLFISQSETERIGPILAAVAERSILTVSDIPDFLTHGGHIQLVQENRRVRFDVNLPAAEKARLKLDANLLRVARKVQREGAVPERKR